MAHRAETNASTTTSTNWCLPPCSICRRHRTAGITAYRQEPVESALDGGEFMREAADPLQVLPSSLPTRQRDPEVGKCCLSARGRGEG
jgi:hypothetical protein